MNKYICIICKKDCFKFKTQERLTKKEFKYRDQHGRLVRGRKCHSCSIGAQRKSRLNSNNKITKKYEKTVDGFLMRSYRNIKSRCTGVQNRKAHLYLGMVFLDKPAFYNWANSNSDFLSLFKTWSNNDYDRKLTPSVDRIDSKKGYAIDNMRWITHSLNSKLGAISKHKGRTSAPIHQSNPTQASS